jgi:hypothetical protein
MLRLKTCAAFGIPLACPLTRMRHTQGKLDYVKAGASYFQPAAAETDSVTIFNSTSVPVEHTREVYLAIREASTGMYPPPPMPCVYPPPHMTRIYIRARSLLCHVRSEHILNSSLYSNFIYSNVVGD